MFRNVSETFRMSGMFQMEPDEASLGLSKPEPMLSLSMEILRTCPEHTHLKTPYMFVQAM